MREGKAMKIAIIINSSSGLYNFRRDLILKLLSQGHEVVAMTPLLDRSDQLRELGIRLLDTPIDRRGINPVKDFKLFKQYKSIITEERPELVITYTIKPNIYGGIAARLLKKQYVVNITGLGTAFEKPGVIRTIVVNLYKIALKNAKVIFFENSGNRDELVSFGCCKTERTIVLNGAGVNTEYFHYQPYPNNAVFKFLFVGRVMKEKGIDELFEAMKRLVNEGEVCFLDVIGSFEEDYKEKLEEYQNAGWLKYHGYQDDVRPFIRDCDCFVLPSYHEGMANTNLECASSGRPIITSDIPGCKEAVLVGKSGFICEPKNTNSLYISMKKMIGTSIAEREKMGLEGRRHMEKHFDKQIVVDRTIKYLF